MDFHLEEYKYVDFHIFYLKYVQFLSYYWENNHNDDYIQFSVVDFDGILFSDCVQLKLLIHT